MLNKENVVKPANITSAADLLKETMHYYHVTQEDLSERLGVSQKYISYLLNRKVFMNEELALRINKVMGLSSKMLLNLDTNYRLNHAQHNKKEPNHNQKLLLRYSWAN